jgi:hypothetical protein
MLIRQLTVVGYPEEGREGVREVRDDPPWSEIDDAIRRLNRSSCLSVDLQLAPGVGSIVRRLSVFGGLGEYQVSGYDDRSFERFSFRDPSRPDSPNLIDLCTADPKAFEFRERDLCNDLTVVLEIVKHFAESGSLDPRIKWEERVIDESSAKPRQC